MPTNESVWQHYALWRSRLLSVRISAVATLVAWEVSFPEQRDRDRNRPLHSKCYFLPGPIGKQKWSGGTVCVCVCHSVASNSKTSTSTAKSNEVPSWATCLKCVCLCVCEWVGWWGAVLMCSLLCGVLCRKVTPLSLPFLLVDYIRQRGRGPDSWIHQCRRSMWLQTKALLSGQLQPTQRAMKCCGSWKWERMNGH